jgi:hypothetical protein
MAYQTMARFLKTRPTMAMDIATPNSVWMRARTKARLGLEADG